MAISRDLESKGALVAKGVLFLVLGTLGSILLLVDGFSWRRLVLLALVVWAFARAYYFAFYVIEKYIDPSFRFAGLVDAVSYLLKRGRR